MGTGETYVTCQRAQTVEATTVHFHYRGPLPFLIWRLVNRTHSWMPQYHRLTLVARGVYFRYCSGWNFRGCIQFISTIATLRDGLYWTRRFPKTVRTVLQHHLRYVCYSLVGVAWSIRGIPFEIAKLVQQVTVIAVMLNQRLNIVLSYWTHPLCPRCGFLGGFASAQPGQAPKTSSPFCASQIHASYCSLHNHRQGWPKAPRTSRPMDKFVTE